MNPGAVAWHMGTGAQSRTISAIVSLRGGARMPCP